MKYQIGQKATIKKTFSKDDVVEFARITGDYNPIHIDEDYAKQTVFGKPIVHGILCTGLISSVIAGHLPGSGSIYLGQELKFLSPVFHDDLLYAEVEIIDIIEEKKHIILNTIVSKIDGTVVIEGKARVKVQTL